MTSASGLRYIVGMENNTTHRATLADHADRRGFDMCAGSGEYVSDTWDARTAGDGAIEVCECQRCHRVVETY